MKLDKRLNLVLEIERADGTSAYVHHSPISREVFKQHYRFITIAMASLYGEGLQPVALSRVVYYRMLEMIQSDKRYEAVEMTLLAEIWRMTYVKVAGKSGYDTIPLVEAIEKKMIDEDDEEELKNYVCFFTAASWVHGRVERAGMYAIMTESGALTTSLGCMEWMPSSKTSKPEDNSGATATA